MSHCQHKERGEELKAAIDKLRQLATENDKMCTMLEEKECQAGDEERVKNLIKTYRYWYQCCLIAAWLLEQERT